MTTVAQMLEDARRVHAANVAAVETHVDAAAASGRLVAMLEARLVEEAGGQMLGIKAAARLSGISARTLRRRAEEGRLGHRMGLMWRFTVDELKALRAAA